MNYGILILIGLASIVTAYHTFQAIAASAMRIATPEIGIGFGPKLFSFMSKKRRINVHLIPFGGYLKVAHWDWHTGSLIELSGVLGTAFVSALILLTAFIMAESWTFLGEPAVVGWVRAHSAAEKSGLHPGDTITDIDGRKIATWQDAWESILEKTDKPCLLKVLRQGGEAGVLIAEKKDIQYDLAPPLPAVIEAIEPMSSADRSGFQKGDRIIRMGQREIHHWLEVEEALSNSNPGMPVTIKRPSSSEEKTLSWKKDDASLRSGMKGPEWQKKHLSIAEAAKELGRWLGYLYGFLFHKKGLFLTPKPSGVDNMLGFLSRMCPFSEPSRPIVILGVAAALTAFFNTLPGPGFAGQRLLLSLLYGRVSDDMFPLIKTITAAIILIIVIAMWVILFIKDVTLF